MPVHVHEIILIPGHFLTQLLGQSLADFEEGNVEKMRKRADAASSTRLSGFINDKKGTVWGKWPIVIYC